MKLARRERPERNLEKQSPNFWQGARSLTGNLHRAITVAFSKTADWKKIQTCTQKSHEPVHDYYSQIQIDF